MSEEMPQTIGRFEVVREIGRGAMGVVYEGRDPRLNRRVAIKTARRDVLAGTESPDELMERFVREAQAAGGLNHPNIVTIYDAGEEDGFGYIAMEYLDGTPLSEEIEVRVWSPGEAAELTATLCRALGHAHERGVIHRDVKPSNIMLLEDGTLKITDFGIARLEASTLTQTGAFFGTPHYMSPEQCLGQHVDGRADLFAAGIVLYQLLTGERPFPGKGINAVMHSVLNETPRPPDQLNPHVPDALNAVTLKSLRKKPGDRYRDGEAMAAALEESLTETPDPAILGTETDDDASARTVAIGTTTHGQLAGLGNEEASYGKATQPASDAPPRQESPAAPENAQATRRLPVAVLAVIALVILGGIVTALALNGGGEDAAPGLVGPDAPVTAQAYEALREGKLDDAERLFAETELSEGLAAVAYERGNLQEALAYAQEAGTPYAQVIAANALRRQGNLDQARQILERMAEGPDQPWQRAEAAVARGRLDHAAGELGAAISSYGAALEINPDDVMALSNQGAAYREMGDLDQAAAAYAKAQEAAPGDGLISLALRQVQQELAGNREARRQERLQQQIERLRQRAAAQADGEGDDWTTRPLVVAVLPGEEHSALFRHAGAPLALRRELQAELAGAGEVELVEREALEAILQEQDIASSDLSDPLTQQGLGRIRAASHLVFTEFMPGNGEGVAAAIRIVDTQTTSATPVSRELEEGAAFTSGAMAPLAGDVIGELTSGRELRGLIADASEPEAVLLNIGGAHGVEEGMRFHAQAPAETVEVGGRSLEKPGRNIATLTVTRVNGDSALAACQTEGAELTAGLRVKQAPPAGG